ncbi:MAG: GHMP kinase [Negativicutes bacterium]|nr:GHMP kinase [Negativicutes bacterium]
MLPTFRVRAGARLHLGQLDLNGSLGRLYGGIGLAVDKPGLALEAQPADKIRIEAPEPERQRAERLARCYLEHYRLPGALICITESLPVHNGLGSGTQLALAIGLAITKLYGLRPSLQELAAITDREGSRSGLGVAAFKQGGFVVDGGKLSAASVSASARSGFFVPPVIARFSFPQEWRIVLATPRSLEKMSGSKEEAAFKSLPAMGEQISGKISRLVLMRLLPALAEKDLKAFGQAVAAIQEYLGDYFAPVQGGRFATNEGARVAELLLSWGAVGVGQSSWGPTVYGFIKREKADELVEAVRTYVGDKGTVWGARGVNHGARWGWN